MAKSAYFKLKDDVLLYLRNHGMDVEPADEEAASSVVYILLVSGPIRSWKLCRQALEGATNPKDPVWTYMLRRYFREPWPHNY
jgi:hypothetical protein